MTCLGKPTLFLDGVLVENIDQLIFTARLPVFGVVGSIVLQEGEINPLLILQRQRFDVFQELVCHLELAGAHPVGAQLHSALHPHEAFVLCAGEKSQKHRQCERFEII